MSNFTRFLWITVLVTIGLTLLLSADPPAPPAVPLPPTLPPTLPPPLTAGQALALSATTYTPVDCAAIVGWDWVRKDNSTVTWEFDATPLAACDHRKVYLNFSGLCTNGANGGSGFDAKLTVTVRAGDKTVSESLPTVNPFKPDSPADSKGVGYAVYGTSGALPVALIAKAVEAGKFTVTLTRKDAPNERHVAVNKGALVVGCLKGETIVHVPGVK